MDAIKEMVFLIELSQTAHAYALTPGYTKWADMTAMHVHLSKVNLRVCIPTGVCRMHCVDQTDLGCQCQKFAKKYLQSMAASSCYALYTSPTAPDMYFLQKVRF